MDSSLKINNHLVSYSDMGSGDVVVFLHGWLDSKESYEPLISILSKKYRCISIDLPGFGKSEIVENTTLPKISRIITNLLHKLDVTKYNLVGHSLGGAVTLIHADKHGDSIDKIVLISPFVTFKQFSKSVFYAIRNFIPVLIQKILNLKNPNLKAVNAFKIAYLLSSVDLFKYLRKVRKDILLVYGTRDSLLSIRPLEPLFGVLNNIHLAIFQDVRHSVISYNPDDLAKKIDLFFIGSNEKII